jgi:hypothetical protein
MGVGLLDRIYALGWARRLEGTRVVAFSAPGLRSFEQTFGAVGLAHEAAWAWSESGRSGGAAQPSA